MNVSRRAANGEKDDEEVLNKSQIYVNFFGQNVTIVLLLFLYITEGADKNVLYL